MVHLIYFENMNTMDNLNPGMYGFPDQIIHHTDRIDGSFILIIYTDFIKSCQLLIIFYNITLIEIKMLFNQSVTLLESVQARFFEQSVFGSEQFRPAAVIIFKTGLPLL